jgi:predicted AlkP superfamily pyrophosphatase or phosphodiesterase
MDRMKTFQKISHTFVLTCLLACQETGLFATPIPTSTNTPLPTLTFTPPPSPTSTPTPLPIDKRVIIISIDGLRPDAIELTPMLNLMKMMDEGAYALNARTIFPSATLPAHASMLTGACPSKHGVNWNDYIPENGFAIGTDVFDLAHDAGLFTAMYVGKEKLRQVTEPSSTDEFVFINDRDAVITEQLIANFPQDFSLLFIHFPTTDDIGHAHGWLSPEQLSVTWRADEALGMLLDELDARGIRDETTLIVTADHGGHDKGHGTFETEDMTIPWIVSGPDVVPGYIGTIVHTMDTAATAAHVLGLPIPEEWDGVPVSEVFDGVPDTMRPFVVC